MQLYGMSSSESDCVSPLKDELELHGKLLLLSGNCKSRHCACFMRVFPGALCISPSEKRLCEKGLSRKIMAKSWMQRGRAS